MKRVLGIIAGLVLLCIVGVVALIGGVFFLTQDMANAGDAFMQAIQENRLEDAYAMLGGEALDDVEDLDAFEAQLEGIELESWSFTSRNVNNDMGDVSGTAVIGGETFAAILYFRKVEDTWQIIGYNFEPVASEEE